MLYRNLTVFILLAFMLILSFEGGDTRPLAAESPYIKDKIQRWGYYEEYMYMVMREFPKLPEGSAGLSRDYIDQQIEINRAKLWGAAARNILIYDYDNDGRVSFEELEITPAHPRPLTQKGVEELKALDKDGDGHISLEESRGAANISSALGMVKYTLLEDMLTLDPNGDGILTRQELREQAISVFEWLDVDGNKILTGQEQSVLFPQETPEPKPQLVEMQELEIGADEELHAVGIGYRKSKRDGRKPPKEIKLQIDRPGKKVALILSSFNSLKWIITTTSGTQISQIYISAHSEQELDSASTVMLNGRKYADAKMAELAYPIGNEGVQFRKLLNIIHSQTGRDRLDSFTGLRAVPSEGFVIDAVLDDPRLKLNRLTVNTEEVPDISFIGALHPAGEYWGKVGEFNVSGKLVKELPILLPAVYVPKEKAYYGLLRDVELKGGGIAMYDHTGNEMKKIPYGDNLPSMNWAKSITYDPETHSIIAFSSWDDGLLASYDIAQGSWSAISLGTKSCGNIDYDERLDGFVCITKYLKKKRLLFFDREGKQQKEQLLDLAKFDGLQDVNVRVGTGRGIDMNVLVTKEHFIFLALDPAAGRTKSVRRIYVQDRNSDDVRLTFFTDE